MSQTEKRKIGKLKITVCTILALMIILLVVLFWFVGVDNIKSVYYGFKYNNQQISDLKAENDRRLEEKVKEYSYIVTREPTQEEMEAISSGEITSDDLSKIISEGITLEKFREDREKQQQQAVIDNPSPSEPEAPPKQEQTSAVQKPATEQTSKESEEAKLQAECDALVSQIVAKMYILRASFTSSLSGLASQALADYKAGLSKAEIASKYIGQAAGLESQCDGNVDALMSELRGILTKYGRSTDLVDTIYSTYNNEKQYTKAHYMGLYLK